MKAAGNVKRKKTPVSPQLTFAWATLLFWSAASWIVWAVAANVPTMLPDAAPNTKLIPAMILGMSYTSELNVDPSVKMGIVNEM